MKASRSRLVIDTNVLIDLHRAEIVELFFALPFAFVSPDVIIAELGDPDGGRLETLGLTRAELTGDQVREVHFLSEHNPEIAVNDIFALVLAENSGLPLLSGDGHLRLLAGKHRVKVHGTLWVLDEMVNRGILTKSQAAHALSRMVATGSRLPPAECAKRLRMWKNR